MLPSRKFPVHVPFCQLGGTMTTQPPHKKANFLSVFNLHSGGWLNRQVPGFPQGSPIQSPGGKYCQNGIKSQPAASLTSAEKQ